MNVMNFLNFRALLPMLLIAISVIASGCTDESEAGPELDPDGSPTDEALLQVCMDSGMRRPQCKVEESLLYLNEYGWQVERDIVAESCERFLEVDLAPECELASYAMWDCSRNRSCEALRRDGACDSQEQARDDACW